MDAAVVLLPPPSMPRAGEGVCIICGSTHTQTLNGEPYDLCVPCEAWWLNQQGDCQ